LVIALIGLHGQEKNVRRGTAGGDEHDVDIENLPNAEQECTTRTCNPVHPILAVLNASTQYTPTTLHPRLVAKAVTLLFYTANMTVNNLVDMFALDQKGGERNRQVADAFER
jgi:hypothetical protein